MATKAKNDSDFDATAHDIVPKHEVCSERMKAQILKKYNITVKNLPRILSTDPAIVHLGVQEGDLIKITRDSMTANQTVYYRIVVTE